MNVESGRGVQVVSINEDHSYQLNKEALRGILLQKGVKEYPVVVVSVAGVCRGGKSFLLGFFLRYLYHKYVSGLDNGENGVLHDRTWLGADDEPLKGFNWRGGSERDTTGILLWSQPIHVTLPSGEKVVVLLMDTQGAFDSTSTVRDCSTIFALSTLISSEQIYNIFHNITEDDFQYLQLFAEYGRLASSNGLKPFQNLKFLVRDWNYAYEHPYGVRGGEELLQKKMEAHENQATELQELRQHILACFEDISCFLMPYPGTVVASDQRFNGKLTEIDENFKQSITELVPSIFETNKLIVKQINGQKIKAGDLYHYFETYIDVFNSDKLPTPVTITKAIIKAAVLAAIDQARNHYSITMDNACGESRPSLPLPMLRETHVVTLDQAQQILKASIEKLLTDRNSVETHTSQLTQELDNKLPQYELINSAKISNAAAKAKATYNESMQSVSQFEEMCLHPQDLAEYHNTAMKLAMEAYDFSRIPPQDAEDQERNQMLHDLIERYNQLQSLNDLINSRTVLKAQGEYERFMENSCGLQPCMNDLELKLKHEEALASALDVFRSKRCTRNEYTEDPYLLQLLTDIKRRLRDLQNMNNTNNEAAVLAAMSIYNSYMQLPCLHPENFHQEHEEAKNRAINEFHSRRLFGQNDYDSDAHKENLISKLNARYEELNSLNNTSNEAAVRAGINAYEAVMKSSCGEGQPWLAAEKLDEKQSSAVNAALRVFNENRRAGDTTYSCDCYKDNLMQDMRRRFHHYSEVNDNNPRNRVVANRRRRNSDDDDFDPMMMGAMLANPVGAIVYGVCSIVRGIGRIFG